MHSQQPPGVVQNWSTLQCNKQNTEQCGYDHAPVTRGRMRAQFPLPHGPPQRPLNGDMPRPHEAVGDPMLYVLSGPGRPRTPEARWPELSLESSTKKKQLDLAPSSTTAK